MLQPRCLQFVCFVGVVVVVAARTSQIISYNNVNNNNIFSKLLLSQSASLGEFIL